MPTLTRDELYALVWSEPIQKIAPRYNISDRGLGKLCARHGIPVPPRGWWARKRAGQRVRCIPLPPTGDGQSTVIVIEAQQTPAPVEPPPPPPPLAREIAFERDPVNAIVVDENAKVTHPLVRDAAAELRSGRSDRDGIIRTPRGCVDVRVTKGSVSRALRILQALFRALEPRGYTVAIKDGKTFITVLGESYRVFLKERLRRTVRDLTPEEHKRRREGGDVYLPARPDGKAEPPPRLLALTRHRRPQASPPRRSAERVQSSCSSSAYTPTRRPAKSVQKKSAVGRRRENGRGRRNGAHGLRRRGGTISTGWSSPGGATRSGGRS